MQEEKSPNPLSNKELLPSLDPMNWSETQATAHQMIDDMIEHIQTLRDRPAWQQMPDELKEYFNQRAPIKGKAITKVYQEFKERILPYGMGNPHPRFWAWYMGSTSMVGAMADFLTSITNSNAGAGNHVGQHIEDQVIRWMNTIVGYPEDASGIIVSGGSMANFVGLSVARHTKAGYDIRELGVRAGSKQMTVYASSETHSCNQKAIELLGIGAAHLRKIAINKDYTIDIRSLKVKIKEDKENGYQPICIIASAGTVNTGAIDDLQTIADICEAEDLWYHVDGAIGAIGAISDAVKPLLKGMERSDSIALDLHKWIHIPFEAGCVLVRDRGQHQDTFNLTPEYLAQYTRGLASGTDWYSKYGIQLSRRLKALKIWMCIQEQGLDKLGKIISQNIDQANYLNSLIDQHNDLQVMAPIGLDIVCFRYRPMQLEKTNEHYDLNEVNKEILILLHERGYAIPSYTTLGGDYCIRVAISNHRSTKEDFDYLVLKVLEIGESIFCHFLCYLLALLYC